MTAIADPPAAASSPAVKALAHPIRRAVLNCIARGITTPKAIAEEIDQPLGVVAYHVRMLRGYGVLELARSLAALKWIKTEAWAWVEGRRG